MTGMDCEAIEAAAGWEGEDQQLFNALSTLRWIDVLDDGTHYLHEWDEHESWSCGQAQRSRAGKKAGKASARARAKALQEPIGNGPLTECCDAVNGASTPSPSPPPIPPPSPKPSPDKKRKKDAATSGKPLSDYQADVDYWFDGFREATGAKASWGDAQGKNLKRIRKTHGTDIYRQRVTYYFHRFKHDKFQKKRGCSFLKFSAEFDTLAGYRSSGSVTDIIDDLAKEGF